MTTSPITQKLGKAVHAPDFGLKVIVAWKLAKAIFLILVAVGAFAFIHKDVKDLAERLVEWFGLDPTSSAIQPVLVKIGAFTTPRHKAEVGTGAIVFAAFLLVEAWGLWNRRIWAELLTIVATSLLIPVELYEIVVHPSLGKVAMLAVNVLIVLYLARHHYLFVPGRVGRWLHAHLGADRPH